MEIVGLSEQKAQAKKDSFSLQKDYISTPKGQL